MRITEWPRMPYLSEELTGWVCDQLQRLGTEDVAVYALEDGAEGEERRVFVATDIGLFEYRYAPREAQAARYGLIGRLYTWREVKGIELLTDTYRVWAREDRTSWRLSMREPALVVELAIDEEILVPALTEFARACMARVARAAAG